MLAGGCLFSLSLPFPLMLLGTQPLAVAQLRLQLPLGGRGGRGDALLLGRRLSFLLLRLLLPAAQAIPTVSSRHSIDRD